MLFLRGNVDDDVINVRVTTLAATDDLVDLMLESSWRVFHTKRHHCVLKQSLGSDEFGNFFVTLCEWTLPEAFQLVERDTNFTLPTLSIPSSILGIGNESVLDKEFSFR